MDYVHCIGSELSCTAMITELSHRNEGTRGLFALEDHVSIMSLLRIADSWRMRGFWNMLFQIFPYSIHVLCISLTLARSLLWASFESTLQEYLPPALTRRIRSAYALVCHLPQGKSPVKKRLVLVVAGSEADLYIDEIDAEIMQTVGGQEDGSGGVVVQVARTHRCIARGTEISPS